MFKHLVLWVLAGMLVLGGVSNVLSNSNHQERQIITPENANQLVERIRLGRGSIEEALFSPDGSTIFVAGSIGIWRYAVENIGIETAPPHVLTLGTVKALSISPDGSTLAAIIGGKIILFDAQTLEELAQVTPSSILIESLVYSPDGNVLAINTGHNGIILYDLITQTETIMKPTVSISADSKMHYSPAGSYFAILGGDDVALWDMVSNTQYGMLGTSNPIRGFAFTSDGNQIVTGEQGGVVRVWDIATLTETDTLSNQDVKHAGKMAVSVDDKFIANSMNRHDLVVWDVPTKTMLYFLETDNDAYTVDTLIFSPKNDQLLAVANHTVYLWSAETGDLIAKTVGHTPLMDSIAFSPDSTTLAIANQTDGEMWLWDVASNQELNLSPVITGMGQYAKGNYPKAPVLYSPDGTMIALAKDANSDIVQLWSTETHTLIHELTGKGDIATFAFSPDNSLLAYGSTHGLYIFSTASGELLIVFENSDSDAVSFSKNINSVVFSPDQTQLAALINDHTVRVYSLP